METHGASYTEEECIQHVPRQGYRISKSLKIPFGDRGLRVPPYGLRIFGGTSFCLKILFLLFPLPFNFSGDFGCGFSSLLRGRTDIKESQNIHKYLL